MFDEVFWRDAMGNLVDGNVFDEEDDEIARTMVKAEDTQICCEKDFHECWCENPIPASEIYDAAEPHWYEDETECMNCVYVSSPACPPLRIKFKQLRETGELGESIAPCGSFKLATL